MKNINETELRLLETLMKTNSTQRLLRQGAAAICGGDRRARDIIHDLRCKRYPICSDSKQGGYFMARKPDDLMPFIKETSRRIKELTELCDTMKANMIIMAAKQMRKGAARS